MYSIYKVTNKIDGKSYVGFTTQNPPQDRWEEHKEQARRQSRRYFHNAIRKYGPDSFSFEILEQGEEHTHGLKVSEPRYILEIAPEFRYNMTLGGDGILGWKHREEDKEKQRQAMTGKIFGPQSILTREKIGNAHRGKFVSPATKQKLSLSHQTSPKAIAHRKQMADDQRGKPGKPQSILVCPYCQRTGGIGGMIRWHFDNCKHKKASC